jgi:cell division protein ZapD
METQQDNFTCSQSTAKQAAAPLSSQIDIATASDTHLLFEQGLNENMRLALRLEHLFKQFNSTMETLDQVDNSRLAMRLLLRILDVAKRPDLKSKIIQSLSSQANRMIALRNNSPESDQPFINRILKDLNTAVNQLHSIVGRVGEKLYENEFLNALHLQLNAMGGGSDDRMPAFKLWLSKSEEEIKQDLTYWFSFCKPLPQIIYLLLAVSRWQEKEIIVPCSDGFYAQTLDSGMQQQILRLQLPKSILAYPEVSVGRHRLSIRFVKLEAKDQGRSTQLTHTFDFKMSICSS